MDTKKKLLKNALSKTHKNGLISLKNVSAFYFFPCIFSKIKKSNYHVAAGGKRVGNELATRIKNSTNKKRDKNEKEKH